MSEQNRQFNAVTPESGSKGKKDDNKRDDVVVQQEKTETSSEQYFEERENSCVYLGVEVPKGSGGELVPNKEAFANHFRMITKFCGIIFMADGQYFNS